MHIRGFRLQDYDAVVALWKECGLLLSASDTPEGMARKLERDADLFLVVEEEHRLLGVIMGCYDGRRGWINHLAVAPAAQGRGIGSILLQEVEQRLLAKGCDKVNLLIEPENADVQQFYLRAGYQRDELIFMEKWLHR
ncbi:ribosomal protein S18 acetylase RimI-like enzyme [Thermosporothrix hazakensis]|uniref:Ribosomal protein S18 acetylase RimI-like enzyme n=2 Tax=Thermosporothrix TaxID=768650 RepID=A0A326U611_THEHA|nr:GNAT family acetyltransferase [Thermosporothrix hazakensis]PZW29390.1 ribosomal protein S18 acetylase RimI-like enzyme [Thermosporothrix hazakensis]